MLTSHSGDWNGFVIRWLTPTWVRVPPSAPNERMKKMDKRQRIAHQRALAEEALGKLRAASQLFGVEDGSVSDEHCGEYRVWSIKIAELEEWIWNESPIA